MPNRALHGHGVGDLNSYGRQIWHACDYCNNNPPSWPVIRQVLWEIFEHDLAVNLIHYISKYLICTNTETTHNIQRSHGFTG